MLPKIVPALAALCPVILSLTPSFAQRYGGWHPGMMDGWGMGSSSTVAFLLPPWNRNTSGHVLTHSPTVLHFN
jgi:hypothetical protein